VPPEVVLNNLAGRIAERVPFDFAEILSGLRSLLGTADLAGWEPGAVDPGALGRSASPESVVARRGAGGDAARETDRPPIVRLGRLRPRPMHADEFPDPGLAEALASRHPTEPQTRIVDPDPVIVQLGRLRPGTRF